MRMILDSVYAQYNRREFVHPDPLEVLYSYDNLYDREIVALIASSLAYGQVKQILKSLSVVLNRLGLNPYAYLKEKSEKSIKETFAGFKHRFTTDTELIELLLAIKRVTAEYGNLKTCFLSGYSEQDETILSALSTFVESIRNHMDSPAPSSLLPSIEKGSACKRLHLFMRWMVRSDEVDPGGWHDAVDASKLIVPLDVHMHRMCVELKMTHRKQASLRCALEATEAFRKLMPEDPVKYDFCLTRFGIRKLQVSIKEFVAKGVA